MAELSFTGVNWMAVGAAGVAMFLLGGVWFQALFGKAWQAQCGYGGEKLDEMRKQTPPPVFLGVMLACYLVMSVVTAMLVVAMDVRGAGAGAKLAGLLWVGPTAAALLTNHIASDRRLGAFAIEAGFLLVAMPVMGVILGTWR